MLPLRFIIFRDTFFITYFVKNICITYDISFVLAINILSAPLKRPPLNQMQNEVRTFKSRNKSIGIMNANTPQSVDKLKFHERIHLYYTDLQSDVGIYFEIPS